MRALTVWGQAHHLSVTEESLKMSGEDLFSFKLEGQSGVQTRDLRFSKQAALTTTPGPPPQCGTYIITKKTRDWNL